MYVYPTVVKDRLTWLDDHSTDQGAVKHVVTGINISLIGINSVSELPLWA